VANYEHQKVVVHHLGKKPSATSSRQLLLGDTVSLVDGDALWLLPDKYKHIIRFCDSNVSCAELASTATSCKRRADDAGSSAELPSKRHSATSATSANNDRQNDELCDEEQDADTKQVEMVCESYTFDI